MWMQLHWLGFKSAIGRSHCVQQTREENGHSLQLNFRTTDRTMYPHATGITDIIIFLKPLREVSTADGRHRVIA